MLANQNQNQARSLLLWLGQKAQVQEVVGSNPAVYWMDVSNLLAITLKKN
jgi:hypothetical protein